MSIRAYSTCFPMKWTRTTVSFPFMPVPVRRKEEAEVLPLPETSYAILDASSAYLREGGVLVYSTCTLRRAENDEVCRRFLAAHPEFSPLDFTFTGRDGTALPSENGMLTLLPAKTHTDGFFLCRMIKKENAHA